MAVYIARNQDILQSYDASGFSKQEVLAGTYEGGVVNYKCFLKAGKSITPELFKDKIVIYIFGKGTGYITDEKNAYSIEELSFYAPYFDRVPYTIYSIDDMEFMMCVVDMNQWDWEVYRSSHARLPFFRSLSQCTEYDQSCKGPNVTSWNVLQGRQLGRIMLGVVRAVGDGTVEKGHPAVHQWNYCLGESEFKLTVDGETVPHYSGEWSYIPAGLDHSLVADPGKEVFYVWLEHFAREKDFIVKPAPSTIIESED